MKNHPKPVSAPAGRGFSMIELLVAMAVFLVIGSAAFMLVRRHIPLFSSQQNQAGLNIALRNTVAQMQIDVVNAGTGYYQGANIPSWPVGLTVINNPAASNCYNSTTHTYGSTCFDTLNVIAADPNTPPSNPTDNGSNCVSTTSSILFVTPTGTTTLAQLAADFHTGDQILVVKSDGSQFATTVLSSNGQVSGTKVQLQHNPTAANGTNSTSNDPLGITTNASNKLGTQFCSTDWVLKLAPVTYWVDASNPQDPKLTRTQGGTNTVLADQVIGFKVGASIWGGAAGYSFDSSSYAYDWTLVRAVRIAVVGRTSPISDPSVNYHNSFDQGPYHVQAISVVINPRNLSMND